MNKLLWVLFLVITSSCTKVQEEELTSTTGNAMFSFKLASIAGSAEGSIADLNLYVFDNDIYIKSIKDIKSDNQGDIKLLLPKNAKLYFTANIKEPSSFSTLQAGVSTLQDFLASAVTKHTAHTENSAPEFLTCVLPLSTSNPKANSALVINLERAVARLDFDMSSDASIKITRIKVSGSTLNSSLFKGSTNTSSMGSVVYEKTYPEPIGGEQEGLFRIYETPGEINITITGTYNGAPIERTAKLSNIKRNTPYKINVTHSIPDDRYFVVAVAGQLNAAGWDFVQAQNPADDAPDPRIFQLSYRSGPAGKENLSIIPMQSYGDDIPINVTANKTRGIHLPLGKQLLKSLPDGYKILFVTAAASASGFSSGDNSGYDEVNMRPQNMGEALQWGKGTPYEKTIIDRVAYALSLNENNKFGGIVWCQGEYDRGSANTHYAAFTAMADNINATLTSKGFGPRTPFATVDKRSWYCFSSTDTWMRWNVERDAIAVFSGYKHWSPDTFIRIPVEAPVNPSGLGGGDMHFGSGAYGLIVAPLVAQCMNENGALLNGVVSNGDRFKNKSTLADAQNMGGKLSDDDIQTGLELHFPFKDKLEENLTLVGYKVNTSGLSLVQTEGLFDINGQPRVRKALQLKRNEGTFSISVILPSTTWSMSFMLKRTGNMNEAVQALISGINSHQDRPFIGFRQYNAGRSTAGISEFVVEPIAANDRNKAAGGNFVFADQVRTLSDWIHYVVTYDHAKKETAIYMNGQEVSRTVINNTTMPNMAIIEIGHHSDLPGVQGQLTDLMIWKRVIDESTINKLFFYNYYGFEK